MSRADRRRQLKEDMKRVARGVDVSKRDAADVVALMRVLHDQARQAAQQRSIDPLMRFLYDNMASTERRLAGVQVACRKGCAFCCRTFVAVTAPEALFAMRGGMRERVTAANALTGGKSYEQRADTSVPCPMLVDNACSIYAARPLVCRAGASVDAGICERSYVAQSGENIPSPLAHVLMGTGYGVALAGALKHAGLAATAAEYNAALALCSDAMEQDWLAGRDVLAHLPRPPGGDLFEAPWNRKLYDEAFA